MTAKARERGRESEDISFSPSFFFSFSRTPVKRLVELLSPTVTLEAACISPPTARPFNSGRVGRWWRRERNGRDRKGGTYKELLLTNWQPHGTTNRKQRLADGSIFQAILSFSFLIFYFRFPWLRTTAMLRVKCRTCAGVQEGHMVLGELALQFRIPRVFEDKIKMARLHC